MSAVSKSATRQDGIILVELGSHQIVCHHRQCYKNVITTNLHVASSRSLIYLDPAMPNRKSSTICLECHVIVKPSTLFFVRVGDLHWRPSPIPRTLRLVRFLFIFVREVSFHSPFLRSIVLTSEKVDSRSTIFIVG